MVVISALKFVHVIALCCLAPCTWSPRVADPRRCAVVPCACVAVHRLVVPVVALLWLGRSGRTARLLVRSMPDYPYHHGCH